MPSLLSLARSLDDPPWCVRAIPHAYEEAGRQVFKSYPGIEWCRDSSAPNGRGYYRGPWDAVALAVEKLEGAGVVKVRGDRDLLAPGVDPFAPEPVERGGLELRSYQREGAAWIIRKLERDGGAILADEMGVGKTPQAIAAVEGLVEFDDRRLVICPAVVERHWRDRIARWSGAPTRWRVLSYDKFRSAAKGGTKKVPPLEEGYSVAIVDECHYLMNPKALRTKAIASFVKKQKPRLLFLSGTPMTARPRDLYSPLEILFPSRFGRFFDFSKRYCDGHWEEIPHAQQSFWKSDGASRVDELSKRLATVMLRRTKAEVLAELPPKTREVIEVEIPARARRDLQKAAAAINWNGNERQGVGDLLANVEAYKIDRAEELAREIVGAGSRVLILTLRQSTAHELGARLKAPVVTGETLPQKREALLRDAEIGIATVFSVTTGIDLVGYDNVIFTGLDWLPSNLLQAEDRTHRIGQLRAVTIRYLIGLGTIDEVVRERVIERLDLFAELTSAEGDERGLSADLGGGSEEDLIAAIVARVTGSRK